MAAVTGVLGNVTLVGGYVTNSHRWNLDYVADAVETTDFTVAAPTFPRTFIPGLSSWSGSYDCFADDAIPVVAPGGAAAAIVLQLVAAQTYTGDAIVTGVRPTTPLGEAAMVTVDFQGTGVLNIT